MKKILYVLIAVLSITSATAQIVEQPHEDAPVKKKRARCSKAYFDLSTGINNNGGLLGLGADVHVLNDFSINGGVGVMSTWGYKLYLGGKCYLKPCHMGWALGGGATYSTGIASYVARMTTVSPQGVGQEEFVELRLLPQTNVFASAYKYWRLGRNKNRIYLQLGISVPVTQEKFRQVSGNQITSETAAVMRFLAPHGLIVGLGFCFGG